MEAWPLVTVMLCHCSPGILQVDLHHQGRVPPQLLNYFFPYSFFTSPFLAFCIRWQTFTKQMCPIIIHLVRQDILMALNYEGPQGLFRWPLIQCWRWSPNASWRIKFITREMTHTCCISYDAINDSGCLMPSHFLNIFCNPPSFSGSPSTSNHMTSAGQQESLLVNASRTSSSCTGAMTAELSMVALESIINTASSAPFTVRLSPVSCHESWFW